jgi:hypothetical protein
MRTQKKKASAKRNNAELRPEYDLAKLKGGVRGKYYKQATASHTTKVRATRLLSD